MSSNTKLNEVWVEGNLVQNEVQNWLSKKAGKEVRLFLKPMDQVRLIRLRSWENRYRLSIAEILDMIVPALRQQVSEKYKKKIKDGLGIRVGTLTGNAASHILGDTVVKKYPFQEHLEVWREKERLIQLFREKEEDKDGVATKDNSVLTVLDAESVEDFVVIYSKQVQKKRDEMAKAFAAKWRKCKQYRNNPWI